MNALHNALYNLYQGDHHGKQCQVSIVTFQQASLERKRPKSTICTTVTLREDSNVTTRIHNNEGKVFMYVDLLSTLTAVCMLAAFHSGFVFNYLYCNQCS